MDDTLYFEQAITEYCLKKSMHIKVGDLTVGELSRLLRRAQELKIEDQDRTHADFSTFARDIPATRIGKRGTR